MSKMNILDFIAVETAVHYMKLEDGYQSLFSYNGKPAIAIVIMKLDDKEIAE